MIIILQITFPRNDHCLLFREYLSHYCEFIIGVLVIIDVGWQKGKPIPGLGLAHLGMNPSKKEGSS